MFLFILIIPLLAFARRHPPIPCAKTAFVLANGEPLESLIFSQIPACLQPGAVRIHVHNINELSATKAQIDMRCMNENCIVYSAFNLGQGDIPHAIIVNHS